MLRCTNHLPVLDVIVCYTQHGEERGSCGDAAASSSVPLPSQRLFAKARRSFVCPECGCFDVVMCGSPEPAVPLVWSQIVLMSLCASPEPAVPLVWSQIEDMAGLETARMNLSDLRRVMGRDAADGPELSDSTLSAPHRPRRQSMDNMDLLKVGPRR